MVKYKESSIYKLCCKDPEITDEYIGSTTNFNRRKAEHKQICCSEDDKAYHYKVYECIRAHGGWNNWDMVEIEKYEAVDRKDLHTRERFWIEKMGATLNKCIPTRSITEWRQNNKEKIIEYRQKNKEKIAKYQTEYRGKNKEKLNQKQKEKTNCECGSKLNKVNLARHRTTDKHKERMEKIQTE